MERINSKILKLLSVFFILSGMPILEQYCMAAGTIWRIRPQLESAILDEDWQEVTRLLERDGDSSSIARIIKAHAYLALNRNNESLCLFLSTKSEDDIRYWREWAQDLVKRNPKSAIAHYFFGDALSRQKNYVFALGEFNMALKLYPDHPLILNARGVIYTISQEWYKARIDFEEAAKHSDFSLADAHANIGFLCIHRKDGSEGALKSFNRALEISPDFALALHGRGCIEAVLYQMEKAEIDFESAKKHGPCGSGLFIENILNFAAYIHGKKKEELLAVFSKEEVSMNLQKTFMATSPGLKGFEQNLMKFENFGGKPIAGQWSFNGVVKSFANLPSTEKPIAIDMIHNTLNNNPNLTTHFYNGANNVSNWNKGLGNMLTLKEWSVPGIATFPGLSHPKTYANIGDTFKDIASGHFNTVHQVDGVLASFEGVTWDEGDWPFVAYYGLMY